MPEFLLFQQLNEAQHRAVNAPDGHLLINAAAGTGKTRTLAARIVHLQATRELLPGSLLALTFSRSAREQLSSRVQAFCRDAGAGSPIPTMTFHGLAYRILRQAAETGESWLRPGFHVYEAPEQAVRSASPAGKGSLIRALPATSKDELDLYLQAIQLCQQGHAILKRPVTQPEELSEDLEIPVSVSAAATVPVQGRLLRPVWQAYRTVLHRLNLIDYAGMVVEATRVLQDPESVTARRVRESKRFILVDEYQDTSRAQDELLFTLAGTSLYLNVVGDSNQTIYTFNGSHVGNILDFESRAVRTGRPVLEPVDLVENYRSTEPILAIANRVLHRVAGSKAKGLQAAKDAQEPLLSYRKRALPSTAVYAPTLELAADFVAQQIRTLIREEGVLPAEIAVLVRKDTEFSPQGQAVRTALAALGVLPSPAPRDPEQERQLLLIARELCEQRFAEPMRELLEQVESGAWDTELGGVERESLCRVLEQTMQEGALETDQAIELLCDAVQSEAPAAPAPESVQIRTVHSAKGEEFRVVFLMYLADRDFPHGAAPDVDEERRLLYVGITRARERLYLVGKPGVHQVNFFGDCLGPEVQRVDWLVTGGRQEQPGAALPARERELVEEARKLQEAEEARRRAALAELWSEDEF